MATPRFFIPPAQWNPEAPVMPPDEARHCALVLRLAAGSSVVLFNGEGEEQSATITEVTKRDVVLEPGPVTRTVPLACRVALGQALPKGKNMELIVQKGTELGVSAVYPIISDRAVVRVDARDLDKKRDKWQRVAIEACKQSGQNILPKVATPASMEETLAAAAKEFDLIIIASLQPGAQPLKPLLADYLEMHSGAMPKSVLVLIGPEGDFTPAEVNNAIAAGARPMTLGPIILRTETAALYSLSVLGHELF
ncbi:16S rRNA (uracil(1498)-N(3))-methyltransferase [Sulfuriroseicoccus oceanibius]|uniref:Ribosomal RNA small subunit methyltransferase E n=1 Tax=Sulfuriroseicoccus oceanibius TaxID=2707525 RepID=A0A6B3L983_9BACT|nr:16S rRNA (uracil(1498)-N(3))-methyltransferase [Sulfuriroseicoccus oceanibius]QQL45084.1 16S rRNA (uracil(1498)-N(3))-methyltransferase [Sulfuriroseicoccus oceanibius]